MRRLVPVVAVLSTIGMLASSVTPAHACYCALSPERLAEPEALGPLVTEAGAIVIGTVAEVHPGNFLPEMTGDVDAVVSVERYLKGSGPERIEVDDPASDSDCGFISEASVDQRYLLVLTLSGEGYKTHVCAGNAILSGDSISPNAERYIAGIEAITGPGEPPTPSESTADEHGPRELMWVAAVIIPLAFLAVAVLAPWHRR